jgi:hypothetical protein
MDLGAAGPRCSGYPLRERIDHLPHVRVLNMLLLLNILEGDQGDHLSPNRGKVIILVRRRHLCLRRGSRKGAAATRSHRVSQGRAPLSQPKVRKIRTLPPRPDCKRPATKGPTASGKPRRSLSSGVELHGSKVSSRGGQVGGTPPRQHETFQPANVDSMSGSGNAH